MKWKYILKRILIAIPTFFGITILAYFILNMAPGSPLDALLADPGITPAELERKRVALGLDQPVIIQYFTWLKQLLTGNLGFSYSTQRPVAAMILERLPATAILAASSIVLSLIVSIPLGIFAASRPNSGRDYFSGGLSMLMMATPNFFVGLVFIYLFAIVFNILPSGGMYSSSGAHTFGDLMKHMILPCLVLSFQQIGGWVRHMQKQYAGSYAGRLHSYRQVQRSYQMESDHEARLEKCPYTGRYSCGNVHSFYCRRRSCNRAGFRMAGNWFSYGNSDQRTRLPGYYGNHGYDRGSGSYCEYSH